MRVAIGQLRPELMPSLVPENEVQAVRRVQPVVDAGCTYRSCARGCTYICVASQKYFVRIHVALPHPVSLILSLRPLLARCATTMPNPAPVQLSPKLSRPVGFIADAGIVVVEGSVTYPRIVKPSPSR
jgi:hypothetical protein